MSFQTITPVAFLRLAEIKVQDQLSKKQEQQNELKTHCMSLTDLSEVFFPPTVHFTHDLSNIKHVNCK